MTATRSRAARPSSASATRSIHPTIVCSRGSPTTPAPSSTPRGCATSTPAPTSPTSCPTYPAQWFGRRTPRPSTMCGSTRATDPPASFAMCLGTPVAADVCVFTEADPGFFVSVDRHLSGRFGDISAHDHETSEAWLIDLAAPAAEPTLDCRAPIRRPVPGGAPSRLQRRPGPDHPHQCRWRRGFQDRLDAARHARSGPLARSRAASAGRLYPDVPGARGLADTSRARGRPAAHRGSAPCERRGARDRIRRGSLFARHRRRLRVRDQPPALHLFVDDDAGRNLGL